jgi:hypothetical protein
MLYRRGMSPTQLGGPHSWSGLFEQEVNLVPSSGTEPWFPGHPVRGPVTVNTDLPGPMAYIPRSYKKTVTLITKTLRFSNPKNVFILFRDRTAGTFTALAEEKRHREPRCWQRRHHTVTKILYCVSTQALWPTQSREVFTRRIKRPGHEAVHLTPCSVAVRNERSYTSTHLTCLRYVSRGNLPLPFYPFCFPLHHSPTVSLIEANCIMCDVSLSTQRRLIFALKVGCQNPFGTQFNRWFSKQGPGGLLSASMTLFWSYS